jgi:hypothetical protein
MVYRLLADATALVHLGFIFFVVLGGLLALRWPGVRWLHLPAALWGAGIEFVGWPCPLTPLEKRLRILGGEAAYEGGFIAHYLMPLIYPAGLTPRIQVALGLLVVAVNCAVYTAVFRRRRRAGVSA